MKRAVINAHLLIVLLALSCKKTEPPPPGASHAPSAQASAAAATKPALAEAPAATVTWVDPPAWQRTGRVTPMRKATYVIPRVKKDEEDGELGVFYFGPHQGGSVEANVDRWIKQFPDVSLDSVKRADRTANGLVEHTVEIESGSFNLNMMGHGKPALKKNYALLGAIVETPSGEYFFKLTGPADTVHAARADFYKLLDSVKS